MKGILSQNGRLKTPAPADINYHNSQSRGGGGFRKAYDQMGRIRNYFGDTVPWFITSATMRMPIGTQKEAMRSLGIESYKSIITELDRPNLYYNIMVSRFGSRFNGEGTALDFILVTRSIQTDCQANRRGAELSPMCDGVRLVKEFCCSKRELTKKGKG